MTGRPLILLGGGFEPHRGPSRRRIDVWSAGNGRFSAVRASRRVRQLAGAPEAWSEQFAPWFATTVRAHPGAVLMATNDDYAWWLARYGLTTPGSGPVASASFEAVRTASVKSRMTLAALGAGLATPKTIVLQRGADLDEAATELRFPMVLKPQMRIGLQHWTRGRIVRDEAELRQAFEWFRREVSMHPSVLADASEAEFPLAQEYVVRPGREVRHIVGYLARSGSSAMRAHRKLLQEPLRFGSGVCFEGMAVDAPLAERLLGLLRQIGYHGVFEAEFLRRGEDDLLIDLNLRPFNGISLTLAMGLDLVTCAYLEASGQHAELEAELAAACAMPFRKVAWCNHAALAPLLAGQWVSGALTAGEVRSQLAWAWRNRRSMVNPGVSRDDLPFAAAYFVRQGLSPLFGPREFLGRYLRSGLDR